MVRLIVAGVAILVAGVVTVVWIFTRDTATHPQTAQSGNNNGSTSGSYVPTQPATSSNSTSNTPADPYARHKELSRSFIAEAPERAEALRAMADEVEKASIAYSKAYESRVVTLQNERQELIDDLASDEDELKSELSKAVEKRDEIKESLDELRASQEPIARFVLAYERMNELQDLATDAEAKWRAAVAVSDEAEGKLEAAEENLFDADEDDDTASLEAAVQVAQEELDEAIVAESKARRSYLRLADELTETEDEVVDTRLELVETEPDEKDILEALKAYDGTLATLAEKKRRIEEINSEISLLEEDLEVAKEFVEKKKEVYDEVHDNFRDIASRAGDAAGDYKRNGGEWRKREAERLLEERDDAKAEDRRAKREYNDARDEARDIKRDIRRLEDDVDDIREEIEEIRSEGKSKKDRIDSVVASIARRVRPQEEIRIEQIEGFEESLDRVRNEVDELDGQLTEVRRAKQSAVEELEEYSTLLENVQQTSAEDRATVDSEPVSALAEELEEAAKLSYLNVNQASSIARASKVLQQNFETTRTSRVNLSHPIFDAEVRGARENYLESIEGAEELVRTITTASEALWTNLWEHENSGG